MRELAIILEFLVILSLIYGVDNNKKEIKKLKKILKYNQ